MEILRPGDKNQVECYDCGSLLGFSPQDVTYQVEPPQGPYEIDSTERYTIECPVSNTTIDVTSKITPAIGQRILDMVEQRRYDEYEI